MKQIYICVRCEDEYEPQTKKEKRVCVEKRHCPYCQAVVYGEVDKKWLPSVRKDEIERKGFHKI